MQHIGNQNPPPPKKERGMSKFNEWEKLTAKSLEDMLHEFLEEDEEIRWIISQRWYNDLSESVKNLVKPEDK